MAQKLATWLSNNRRRLNQRRHMTQYREIPHSSYPETGAGEYGLCSQLRQCWFISHLCKRNCPPKYNGPCSVPPRQPMYLLLISMSTGLKQHGSSLYDPIITGRPNLVFQENHHIQAQFNRTNWKRITRSYVEGCRLYLQSEQCCFVLPPCSAPFY